MQSILEKYGLTWSDVAPIIELAGSSEEVEQASNDPWSFMQLLGRAAEPIAVKLDTYSFAVTGGELRM